MQRAEPLRQRAGGNSGEQGGKDCSSLLGETGGERSCPRSPEEPQAPSLRASHFTAAGDTPRAPVPKNLQAEGKRKEGEAASGLNPLLEMTNEGQTCQVYQRNKS